MFKDGYRFLWDTLYVLDMIALLRTMKEISDTCEWLAW